MVTRQIALQNCQVPVLSRTHFLQTASSIQLVAMLAISSHAAIAYLRAPAPIMNGAYAGTTPVTAEYVKSLPGVVAPFTNGFDPLGLAPETQEAFLMYREAELAHGRVAMMAALGFFVQEQFRANLMCGSLLW